MSPRPRILITPDVEDRTTRRGPIPAYFLERSYADAVRRAGGLPWVLPYDDNPDTLAEVFEQIDGLLLTGGAFDVDPALFGAAPHPKLGTLKPDRTRFESALFRLAQQSMRPVLAICGGMQLINVLEGGTLWQDLPSEAPSDVVHEQIAAKTGPGHGVAVVPGTRFSAIVGTTSLPVNSTHHQAIRTVASCFVTTAVAEDGIVEAFEDPNVPFLQAVQWHPEAMINAPAQDALYAAFVDAACRHAQSRSPRDKTM